MKTSPNGSQQCHGIVLILTFAFLFNACKKDPQSKALSPREWYETFNASSRSIIKSTKSDSISIKQNVNWDDERVLSLEDGTKAFVYPVSIISKNKTILKGAFELVLVQLTDDYKPCILYNDQVNFHQKATDEELTSAYHKAIRQSEFISLADKKLMFRDQGTPNEICIDWYWTTYEYDDYGNVVAILSETYLYTTCTSDGTGGGSGGGSGPNSENDTNCEKATQKISYEEVSSNAVITDLNSAPETRTKLYGWIFLINPYGQWRYESYEKGTHKKTGNEWQWDKLEHLSFEKRGIVMGGSISATLINATPTVGLYNAGMSISYHFEASAVCSGSPISISHNGNQDSPVWNVNGGSVKGHNGIE